MHSTTGHVGGLEMQAPQMQARLHLCCIAALLTKSHMYVLNIRALVSAKRQGSRRVQTLPQLEGWAPGSAPVPAGVSAALPPLLDLPPLPSAQQPLSCPISGMLAAGSPGGTRCGVAAEGGLAGDDSFLLPASDYSNAVGGGPLSFLNVSLNFTY